MSLVRTLPPAGTVIPGRLLLKGLWGALNPGDARNRLASKIKDYYGTHDVYLLNSGRAVLTVLLQAMKQARPHRTEVILPGYTCYSVAAAAVRVGLKVRPVDIRPDSLDYDPDALDAVDTSNTLALITANLFGIPNDLLRLESFCQARGIFMVDDAAQAMHARVGDRWVGTFGDAGVFSFDKGKNITTIQGGVLLLQNQELSEQVGRSVSELPEPSSRTSAILIFKLVVYWLFLRPWLYWIPDRLLALGQTPWEVEYSLSQFPRRLCSAALAQISALDLITERRRGNATTIQAYLGSEKTCACLRPDAYSVFPRLPFLTSSAERRQTILEATEHLGISKMYPKCLADLKQLARFRSNPSEDTPGARETAERLVTLPTHGYLREHDLQSLARILTGR